jgi:DNA invertase Pin-like site-specific DNA recombinase
MRGKPRAERLCADCGGVYAPSGAQQQRCLPCGAVHTRRRNAELQRARRARRRTPQEAERIQRKAWRVQGAKYRAESLHADGMSPSAAALLLGISHHTILNHLAQPEAQRRVAILRRLDMPELPH